jgi:hypothetical protein
MYDGYADKMKPLTPKRMGKYLKQGFVRALEWQLNREEISYSKWVDLMEEECIKNYKEETFNTKER